MKVRATVPEAYALDLNVLLFGRHANGKKKLWVDEIGFEAIEMRMMIMMLTLLNVQKNRFCQVRSATHVTDVESQ